MNMALLRCPQEYYDNCLNAPHQCRRCAAGYGSPNGKLYYQPREHGLLPPHPHRKVAQSHIRQERQLRRQQTRSQIVRRARQEEHKARESLIQATVNSGARYGDGDYRMLDWLHCDHKHRQKPQRRFHLTLEEYEKGLGQGVESWIITIHPQEGETLRGVFLTEQAFARLLQEAGLNKIEINKGDENV